VASPTPEPGLIDTDLLIDAARGLPAGVRFLQAQQASSGIQISIISAMELIAGCRDSRELDRTRQSLDDITVLPVTEPISLTARKLMESFFLSHGLLIPDALIAATAIEQQLVLYTKNIRHFQMIPPLAVSRPY